MVLLLNSYFLWILVLARYWDNMCSIVTMNSMNRFILGELIVTQSCPWPSTVLPTVSSRNISILSSHVLQMVSSLVPDHVCICHLCPECVTSLPTHVFVFYILILISSINAKLMSHSVPLYPRFLWYSYIPIQAFVIDSGILI
jgi:hypothetical protein